MKLLQAGERIWMKGGLLFCGGYGPGTVVASQTEPDDAVMFVLDGMDIDGAPCVCARHECVRMRKERQIAKPLARALPARCN